MGRQMPWDDIPDSNVFQTGSYQVVGVELKEIHSANGKLMYSMDVAIADHPKTAMYTNMHYFENFVVGSDEDPEATVPGTWAQSFGAKRLKQLVAAAQIAEKADMEKICASFRGTQFGINLLEYKEPEKDRDGNPNQYAGQERNKLNSFWKIGEREPEIAPKKAVAGVPVKAPVAPTAPPLGPAGAAMPPAAPIQAISNVVAPVAPVAPVAVAPPVAPAPIPVALAAPVPPVAPAPVAAAPTGQVLPCNICGRKDVPSLEFADHIQGCLVAQAAK